MNLVSTSVMSRGFYPSKLNIMHNIFFTCHFCSSLYQNFNCYFSLTSGQLFHVTSLLWLFLPFTKNFRLFPLLLQLQFTDFTDWIQFCWQCCFLKVGRTFSKVNLSFISFHYKKIFWCFLFRFPFAFRFFFLLFLFLILLGFIFLWD